ncbi:MAG: hypothetical protein ACREX5_00580, partial [Achromobacter pestifer]
MHATARSAPAATPAIQSANEAAIAPSDGSNPGSNHGSNHGAAHGAIPAPATASPWPIFWVASIAVFLVSLDGTMLYAAFGALRAGFPEASAADMS